MYNKATVTSSLLYLGVTEDLRVDNDAQVSEPE